MRTCSGCDKADWMLPRLIDGWCPACFIAKAIKEYDRHIRFIYGKRKIKPPMNKVEKMHLNLLKELQVFKQRNPGKNKGGYELLPLGFRRFAENEQKKYEGILKGKK